MSNLLLRLDFVFLRHSFKTCFEIWNDYTYSIHIWYVFTRCHIPEYENGQGTKMVKNLSYVKENITKIEEFLHATWHTTSQIKKIISISVFIAPKLTPSSLMLKSIFMFWTFRHPEHPHILCFHSKYKSQIP